MPLHTNQDDHLLNSEVCTKIKEYYVQMTLQFYKV